MKKINLLFLFFVFVIALSAQSIRENQKNSSKLFNKERIFSIAGKSIGFFLNHPKIDSNSKKFYNGELAVANDSATFRILDLAVSADIETRPFYFFVLNKIVEISDNTMIVEVSKRCKDYLELYPCDFFQTLNQPEIEVNIVKWTTYVGLCLSGGNKYLPFKANVESKIRANCPEVQDLWKSFSNEVRMCMVR